MTAAGEADDKPNARRLGWHVHETTYPFRNEFMALRHDRITWPDGRPGTYSYVEIRPVVMVLPITTDHKVVLIRQYRYTVDNWCWEIPAGGSHDYEGDNLESLAHRELKEEIGGRAGSLDYVGMFRPAIGKLSAEFHLYMATDVRLGPASPEPGEIIQIHTVSVEQAIHMARDGTMSSSSSAYALLLCEPRLLALKDS